MEIDANNKYQAISVSRLEIGMYVAELDRPWKETPFQYKGFEILSMSEIDLLQQHCDTVFVDPGHVSTLGTNRQRVVVRESAAAQIEAQRLRLLGQLTDSDAHDYSDTRRPKQDAKAATKAFNHARAATERLFHAISTGKPVEAPHCRGVVEPLVKCTLANPDAMAWLTFINKSDPQRHDRRISTAVWASIFARYLGMTPPAVLDVATGGLLLDIGFTRIASSLQTHDGLFAGRERLAMQSHVRLGFEMLGRIPGITDRIFQMQRQHHERIDGSGYPRQLKGEAIGAYGSMAAIVDCYDAMITDTPYRPALSSAAAITELNSLVDTHFPRLHVQCFVQSLGMFPSGSIVQLNTGEVAIVIEQDSRHRLRPVVLVVCNDAQERLEKPYKMKLVSMNRDANDENSIWIDRGHPTGTYGIHPQRYFE
ncbi:MAG: HD-GYP domain-containing protein [Woeseiaceae bacterium]